ncbi:hypothetical protein ACLOJK_009758 [Asimina triloba]
MASFQGEEGGEILQAQTHVWNHIFQFINSMSLKCAVQLGIPDTIHRHGQPMTISELAAAVAINPAKTAHLGRLMRLLVHSGFFAVRKIDGREQAGYVLAPPSKLLLSGTDQPTVAPFLRLILGPILMAPWQSFSSWFAGEDPTAFHASTGGEGLWDIVLQNSSFNDCFNDAMASDARLLMGIVVKECGRVFQGLGSLVDVGGGTGATAETIANAFPQVKCSVLDRPNVVATAPKRNNVTMIGGNMFESIPSADAVLLKWVLHDWNDEACVKLLQRCKEAIPSRDKGGKVIIIDMVVNKTTNIGDPKALETQLLFDVLVLVETPGKERDEKEWQKIFTDAGFTDYKITHDLGVRSVIEVYP